MKEPKSETKLTDHPDYLKAIGTLAVEVVCLEVMVVDILGCLLNIPPELAHEVYFTPRSHSARVQILENVAKVALTQPEHKKIRSRVLSMVGRVRGVMDQRHKILHEAWGKFGGSSSVSRRPLPIKDSAPPRPISIGDIENEIRTIRLLTDETDLLFDDLWSLIEHDEYDPWRDTQTEQAQPENQASPKKISPNQKGET